MTETNYDNEEISLKFNSDKNQQPEKTRERMSIRSTNNTPSFIDNISLSSESKIFLILRIIIFVLLCFFFPMHTLVYLKLSEIELRTTSQSIPKILSEKVLQSQIFFKFTYFLSHLLGGKNSIIIYISMVYMLFHPFIALKLVYVTNFVYFGIIMLQCLYQGHRPYWDIKETHSKLCSTNYSTPSANYFLITFFILYLLVCFRMVNQKNKLSYIVKFIFLSGYLFLITITALILLISQQNYIYQLMFSLVISFVLTCIFIDIDKSIHNFILKSLKNVYKTRKYKMKILFYVITVMLIATISFFCLPNDNLNFVEDILDDNEYCDAKNLEQLGVKKTFQSASYIFGIAGAFWGASFTVEKECGIWWNSSVCNLILKIIITLLINIIFIVLMNYIPITTYEFNFVVEAIKYFLHYYIVMGWLPWWFNIMKMNQSIQKIETTKQIKPRKMKSQIFSKTIFSQKFSKEDEEFLRSSNRPLLKNEDRENLKILNEENEKGEKEKKEENIEKKERKGKKEGSMFKKSLLVREIQKHPSETRLDFTIDKEQGKTLEKEGGKNKNSNEFEDNEKFLGIDSD